MATEPDELPRARRRGAALTRAIFEATLAELAESSVDQLTFDKIAIRARTGKAALYRRWRSPAELVLAALADPEVGFTETTPPATGSLRGDLLALLTKFARALDEPHGRALRPLMTQRDRHPQLYAQVWELVVQPRQRLLTDLLRAAAERGEVRADAVTARVAGVGPRLVIATHMDIGTVPATEVEAIVDEVLLPLLRP
ncbi:TetR-like C-terminal domain-containing protein [Amycolatopsis pithecellobii]|uniref:TetR family transcriptional regulator n=1 Tax=Amycolatopsis pithecellobii TaxID=664692 RepID=A0A6N7YUQ7_9PSEU|nr:TetR/AcrR family transcriptional regulator [Amycolatopsis pithecellobii]MTD52593.1 TetR family transcriptional regulator [Amycolatopsis pithecellobii]